MYVLPISTMSLSSHGNLFLKTYLVFKKIMVHDRYILYTMIFNGVLQEYRAFQLIAILSQKKPWDCHHKSDPTCTDALRDGGQHVVPSKACFTEHSCMKGICQVYPCHIFYLDASESASAEPAEGPAGSPKRAGPFQTWNFCRSFGFWRQKGHQLEV